MSSVTHKIAMHVMVLKFWYSVLMHRHIIIMYSPSVATVILMHTVVRRLYSTVTETTANKQTKTEGGEREKIFSPKLEGGGGERIPVRVQAAPKSQVYLFLCSLPSATRRLIHGYSPFSISASALVRHDLKSLPNTLFVSLFPNRYPFSQPNSTCLADHL